MRFQLRRRFRRLGGAGHGHLRLGSLAALGDARRLAGSAAKVIELGATNGAMPHHLDRADPRRIKWEDALHTLAVGDLAQREAGVEAGVLAGDAHALEA